MMNKLFYNLLLLIGAVVSLVSCTHKELSEDDLCDLGDFPIKVVVEWDDPATQARSMRINLFSQTEGVNDYGRDEVPPPGVKYIYLHSGASYRPYCYDYNASNIYFRNEQDMVAFEAYFAGLSRATYEKYVSVPTKGESTVNAPDGGEFYMHAWTGNFDVKVNSQEEQILPFQPKNILRQFTYRVNRIGGWENIKDARGACSGMAAIYLFYTNEPTDLRSTMLFGNVKVGYDSENEYGYLEGEFYTFGPKEPYENWFTMELYSKKNTYYTASWNVSDQVQESMDDRPAKLARDGYDILIDNNPDDGIPDIDPTDPTDPTDPSNPEYPGNGGFIIGVGDWGDEVIIELK